MNRSRQEPREAGASSRGIAIGKAFGALVLKDRGLRRNALFGLTLLVLLLVFGGSVILGDDLMRSPLAFLLFWGLCFLLVGLVLMLALYDLIAVRREHRRKVRDLHRQMAEATARAREAEDASGGAGQD